MPPETVLNFVAPTRILLVGLLENRHDSAVGRQSFAHAPRAGLFRRVTILALDHVQLAMPAGEEDRARAFYRDVLGLAEILKPPALAARGGVWFGNAAVQLHLGVEADFRPARKAHPALRVDDLGALDAACRAAGVATTRDDELPGCARLFVSDPFGNRIELLQPRSDTSVGDHIIGLERAALDRWGSGDPGGFLDAYAPEITYFDPLTPARIDGHDAMTAYYAPWIGKIRIPRYEMRSPRVVVTAEMAVLSYNLINCVTDEMGVESIGSQWNSTVVYQRQDGVWRSVHSHWSFTRHPALQTAGM